MHNSTIWLSEKDVGELASINTALDALRTQLPREAAGQARNVAKVLASWEPRASMHSLGSVDSERGYGGFKSWINTPAGAQAIFVLFDTVAGKVLALMDAGTLGALRTSAIAGLATDIMADPSAESLTIIGSGRQALAQVAAVSAVRKLSRIHVYSRTETNKLAFRDRLANLFRAEVIAEPSLESAVQAAPILTLVTRAREPYLTKAMLRPGMHVNAVGAILPGFAEMDEAAVARFGTIAVDSLENARKGSAELIGRFGAELAGWGAVASLGQIIREGSSTYRPDRISCFKAMGMGLSDLAVAIEVHKRAVEKGVGQPLTTTPPSGLRWDAMPVPSKARE